MSGTTTMTAKHAALIYGAIAMAGPDGITKQEILDVTGLQEGQWWTAWNFLRDTMVTVGTPINVAHSHPFTYSVPRPDEGEVTLEHECWRLGKHIRTSLTRLMIHATIGKLYHPATAQELEQLQRMANRSIKQIDKVLESVGYEAEEAEKVE